MPGRKDVYRSAMNQGHNAAWEEDWAQAADYYRQALQEFPGDAQALNNLALAYYQTQQYEEALKVYLQAAKAAPQDPVPMEKASEIYERLGSSNLASESAYKAAELYARAKDLDKAIHGWMRVAYLSPEFLPARSRLAVVYDRLGNKRMAVPEYIAVASLLQNAGHKEKALQAMQRAEQLMPGSPQISQVVAMIRGDRLLPKPTRPKGTTGWLQPQAVEEYRPVPASSSPKETQDPITSARQRALTVLAGLLFESEEVPFEQESRKGLQSIVQGLGSSSGSQQADHERLVLHLSQVVDFQTRDLIEDAAKELEKAISLGLDHPAAYFDLGYLQAESERLESAVRSLRHAAADEGFALGSHLLMGQIHRKMGKTQVAAVDYLRALRLADASVVAEQEADNLRQLYDPLIEAHIRQDDPQIQNRLCDNIEELLLQSGWQERLLTAREQLPQPAAGGPPLPLAEILTASTSSHVVESLAKINQLVNQERWRTALDEAMWAIQHAPSYLPLHIYMAEMLIKLGRLQDAVTKLSVVSRTYAVRGDQEQSLKTLQRIVELVPTDMQVRRQLIDLYINQKNMQAAADEYIQLASSYYNRAELDKARQAYSEALRLAQSPAVDPELQVKILYKLADIDLQSLEWRQALRVFDQIRSLDPTDEKARLNLINLHLRLAQNTEAMQELDGYLGTLIENKKIAEAYNFLEALVLEQPEVLPIRYRLAELYRQGGRSKQAVDQFDVIVEKLLVAGDYKGAVHILNTIIKMNPPNADEYRQVLNELQNRER